MENVKYYLDKIFGKLNMTWVRVIVFALCAGIYTGIINQIPVFQGTSFQDIAVSYEFWILFAVIIAVNCKKWWESGLKVFVFFLISQPVVYLVELPTVPLELSLQYYRFWFIITLFTLPGGALAFFLTKKNLLSALVLSAATAILGVLLVYYMIIGHIISALVCAVQIAIYLIVFTPTVKLKAIVLTITVIATVGCTVFSMSMESSAQIPLPEGHWRFTMTAKDGSRIDIMPKEEKIEDDKIDGVTAVYYYNSLLSVDKDLIFTDENGNTMTYEFRKGILSTFPKEDTELSSYNDPSDTQAAENSTEPVTVTEAVVAAESAN